MNVDLSGYKFTNGSKVADWIASLPADDRPRAARIVEDFVAERKPLNMLQVKIRLTAPAAESDPELDSDKVASPEATLAKASAEIHANDVYNAPGPIKPTVDTAEPATTSVKARKLTINKLLIGIAIVILVIAVFTNPSRQTHVSTLTESVARATARSIGHDVDMDISGDMFGLSQPRFTDDVIESLVYDVLSAQLEYHNYILFSTCSAPVGFEDQTVSIGAFGMVRATDENLTVN